VLLKQTWQDHRIGPSKENYVDQSWKHSS
jgi:hypothetical protein